MHKNGSVWPHLTDLHQWRVCFRWRDGDAYEVEIVDYH
jgi:plasmid maintenance system killer protein